MLWYWIPQRLSCSSGWQDKLRRVCGNDEGWNGLEESIETVFKRALHEPRPEVAKGRIIADDRYPVVVYNTNRQAVNSRWKPRVDFSGRSLTSIPCVGPDVLLLLLPVWSARGLLVLWLYLDTAVWSTRSRMLMLQCKVYCTREKREKELGGCMHFSFLHIVCSALFVFLGIKS